MMCSWLPAAVVARLAMHREATRGVLWYTHRRNLSIRIRIYRHRRPVSRTKNIRIPFFKASREDPPMFPIRMHNHWLHLCNKVLSSMGFPVVEADTQTVPLANRGMSWAFHLYRKNCGVLQEKKARASLCRVATERTILRVEEAVELGGRAGVRAFGISWRLRITFMVQVEAGPRTLRQAGVSIALRKN